MLNDRRRKILNALIEEYISTALPVSSRAIAGNHGLGVSSATVRNELYVLEEDGYVVSPHVSSGRVPTDTGYRTFVDELLQNIPENSDEEQQVDEQIADELQSSADELDDLLKQTSRALNRFTDCLAVVMAPRITKISLKQISLVRLDTQHVIAVMVLKDGRVLNTVIELEHEYSNEELLALEAMVNREFEIKGSFDPLAKDNAQQAAMLGDAVTKRELEHLVKAIDEALFDSARQDVHFNGVEDLFSQPEMQQMSLAMGFAHMLEDDLAMFRLMGDFLSSQKPIAVRIGTEHDDKSLSNISVVASSYGSGDSKGTIAIVGPTRMNYGKIIDAVRYASNYLDDNIQNED